MAYMTDKKTNSDFARRLDDAVKAIKSGEGWRIEYMQLKEKMDENFEAGENNEKMNTAKRMLRKGKYDYDEISECTGLPVEKIKEIVGEWLLTLDGTAEDISKEMKDFMAYMTDKKTDSDFAGTSL